jgi:hypothetical protein
VISKFVANRRHVREAAKLGALQAGHFDTIQNARLVCQTNGHQPGILNRCGDPGDSMGARKIRE